MALNHHDQEIVDLYHEGSIDEPPAKLDAAILSAARAALAESSTPAALPRKIGWWKRFSAPAQFAVSFMLVAMLSILLTREADVPPMPHGEKAKAVVAADSSVDWVAPVAPQTESDAVPPAASLQAKRPALSELTAKAEREEKAPEKRKTHADFAEALAPQSPVFAPAAEPLKPQDAAEISLPMPVMAPATQAVAKSARKAETLASMAKENLDVQRSVKDWLDEMMVLLDQGKIVEARRLAEAFQKAYPDEALPDNLKKRLAP